MYVITPYTDLLLNVERWLLLNGADGTISESDGSASVLDGSAVSADPPTPVSKNTTTPSTLTLDPGTAALFQGTRTPVSALALAFDGWRRLLPGVCTLVEQARDAMVAEGMSESSARGATDNGNGTGASAARMLDVLRTRAACAVGDERTVMLGYV